MRWPTRRRRGRRAAGRRVPDATDSLPSPYRRGSAILLRHLRLALLDCRHGAARLLRCSPGRGGGAPRAAARAATPRRPTAAATAAATLRPRQWVGTPPPPPRATCRGGHAPPPPPPSPAAPPPPPPTAAADTPPDASPARAALRRLQNGSDVRGVALPLVPTEPVTLTPADAADIGAAFAAWAAASVGVPPASLTVTIGRDSRLSGPALAAATAAGVASTGAGVVDFGVATTPAMFMSTVLPFGGRSAPAGAAVMLTASHLPPNRNGLKFFTRGGGRPRPT
ncbi:hypothetical protein BU14_0522s0007 [Porphyra umbilicalis]|uniref:Alpha-D-phosphohexomutase alpha/beta/alpha domain-containing protein n=1 Tax=Porphyra umbilicalis TaxID=2786 RepID=A0A1X6NSG5_PORUM|nr:hypothetical protein BU14_0522s0007 [Porphyra umbilicalis]|eukprot:OSX71554.1 hypothetical protein BU14_0522s0007 [Porphyra umbilicalis]